MTEIITIPQDSESEQIVLSVMLNSINGVNWGCQNLNDQDFHDPQNRCIFKVIQELYKMDSMVDYGTVRKHTESTRHLREIGGAEYLHHLSRNLNGGHAIEFYGNRLKNLSSLRRVIYSSKDAIYDSSKVDASASEVVDSLQNKLFHIQGITSQNIKLIPEIMKDFHKGKSFQEHFDWVYEEVRQGRPPYAGIATGYKNLDATLGFLRPSCLYVIGARTSMGKTTFILNLMKNMSLYQKKTKIGFFSLEMPATTIFTKLLCLFCDIKFSKFEDGLCTSEEKDRVINQIQKMKDLPLYLDDPSGIKLSQLRSRAKRMLYNFGIEILFIDYLTLIRSDEKFNNKHLEVDAISKGLQTLAKELNIPIVVLAQLNRASVKKEKPFPSLADFRESGSIEEDADGCILLHRPEYYDPNNQPGIIKVYVAKNRLRGKVCIHDFHCNSHSEVYHELNSVEEDLHKINSFMDSTKTNEKPKYYDID